MFLLMDALDTALVQVDDVDVGEGGSVGEQGFQEVEIPSQPAHDNFGIWVGLTHGLAAGGHPVDPDQRRLAGPARREIAHANHRHRRAIGRPVAPEPVGARLGQRERRRLHLASLVLLAPQRVQSLTMCASFARLDPLGRRVLANMREVLEWTRSWPAHARHSVQYFVSPDFFNANPERVAAIEKLIGGETRLQACYVRQNHACQEHDTLERLAEIRCPALILAGGRDPICSPTATRWMSERLRGAETVMFENSSHFFLMEEPERFMRVMDDWLARHTPAAREVA